MKNIYRKYVHIDENGKSYVDVLELVKFIIITNKREMNKRKKALKRMKKLNFKRR